MGKTFRWLWAVLTPLLAVLIVPVGGAADAEREPACAEIACRVCPVVMKTSGLVTGEEPGYCAA